MKRANNLAEAETILQDIEDLLSSSEQRTYLMSMISKADLLRILDEICKIFSEHEKFERCSRTEELKSKIEKFDEP